jgi:hypothetical protein
MPEPNRSTRGWVKRPCPARPLSARLAGAAFLAIVAAGCAPLACDPLTIVVSKKAEYGRPDTVPRGFWTTGTGMLEEIPRPTPVREYWLQSEEGTWYWVSADQYKAAEVSQRVPVCR